MFLGLHRSKPFLGLLLALQQCLSISLHASQGLKPSRGFVAAANVPDACPSKVSREAQKTLC